MIMNSANVHASVIACQKRENTTVSMWCAPSPTHCNYVTIALCTNSFLARQCLPVPLTGSSNNSGTLLFVSMQIAQWLHTHIHKHMQSLTRLINFKPRYRLTPMCVCVFARLVACVFVCVPALHVEISSPDVRSLERAVAMLERSACVRVCVCACGELSAPPARLLIFRRTESIDTMSMRWWECHCGGNTFDEDVCRPILGVQSVCLYTDWELFIRPIDSWRWQPRPSYQWCRPTPFFSK